MGERIREGVVGGLFVLAGISVWATGIARFADLIRPSYGAPWGPMWAVHPVAQDLRWASIVLALAGLLLVIRRSGFRIYLVAGVAVMWLGADTVVRGTLAHGWPAALGFGLGMAVVVAVAVVVGLRTPAVQSAYDPVAVMTSVVTGCVGITLSVMYEYVTPAGLVMVGRVLGPALVVAAVVVVVLTDPRLTAARAILAIVLAAAVVLLLYPRLGHEASLIDLFWLVVLLPTGLTIGLCLLADPVGPRRDRPVRYLLLPFAISLATVVAIGMSFAILVAAMDSPGDHYHAWLPYYGDEQGPGVAVGLVLGFLLSAAALTTLVPTSLLWPAHATEPEPSTADSTVEA